MRRAQRGFPASKWQAHRVCRRPCGGEDTKRNLKARRNESGNCVAFFDEDDVAGHNLCRRSAARRPVSHWRAPPPSVRRTARVEQSRSAGAARTLWSQRIDGGTAGCGVEKVPRAVSGCARDSAADRHCDFRRDEAFPSRLMNQSHQDWEARYQRRKEVLRVRQTPIVLSWSGLLTA
jgi:hypothetical protein